MIQIKEKTSLYFSSCLALFLEEYWQCFTSIYYCMTHLVTFIYLFVWIIETGLDLSTVRHHFHLVLFWRYEPNTFRTWAEFANTKPNWRLCTTVFFTNLGKLKLTMVVQLQALVNFCYCPSCLLKWSSLQNWSKSTQNNQLANNDLNPWNSLYYSSFHRYRPQCLNLFETVPFVFETRNFFFPRK